MHAQENFEIYLYLRTAKIGSQVCFPICKNLQLQILLIYENISLY